MTNINSDISEFEKILNNIKAVDYNSNSFSINKMIELVCSISKIGSKKIANTNHIKQIFDKSNSEQEKKSAAACLLRILCSNDSFIFDNIELRIKTFTLFDESISYLYNRININKSDDNHIKLPKLKDLENKIFDKFYNFSQSIDDLSNPILIRERYISEINNPLTNLFFRPFVDSKLIDRDRLNDIFNVAENYFNAAGGDKLEFYRKASEIYDSYLNDVRNEPSIFAQKCLFDPINSLYNRIKSDFDNIGIIKSTELNIIDTHRKYALHESDKALEIKYIIVNEGPGYAFDVEIEILDLEGLEVLNTIINLGNLQPGKTEIIFDSTVHKNTLNKYSIYGQLSWRNYKEPKKSSKEFLFQLTPQRADINWEKIKYDKPYSLEAVETENDLIGRKEVVGKIFSKLTSKIIESSIIYGQKRVGKTSIAKILKAKLEKDSNYIVIFITVGDLDKTTTLKFVTTLGEAIFHEIKDSIGKITRDIEDPVFDGALSPLVRYFKQIEKIDTSLKFVIIIDEFDELPSDLKYYTNVGDTFFHNIRSISSKGQIGFVLVGAENMQIIKQSTDKLNKFDSFRVDYFDKSSHWKDFNDLVSRPTHNCLEYSDDAINELYEITEGNPFFTKLVCGNIFTIACDRHNSFVSSDEVKEAIRETIKSLDTNQFNHFWKDGINEDDPAKIDSIETQRRKLLISYSEIKRTHLNVRFSDLEKSVFCKDVAISEILESFVNRTILVKEGDFFRIRPRIFENWLIELGGKSLTSTLLDERTFEVMRNKEAEAYVKDQELANLVEKWGLYRGSSPFKVMITC